MIHINGSDPKPLLFPFLLPIFPVLPTAHSHFIISKHPGETDGLTVDFAPFSFSRLLK